jgi:predicted O-methyltransferase YrrM
MKSLAALISTVWDIICIYTLFVFKHVAEIGSSTCYTDLHFLFLLARDGWGKGVIVEIGAFKGKSTCMLALGSMGSGRETVVSIDPHLEGTQAQCAVNMKRCKVSFQVYPIISDSESARVRFTEYCNSRGMAEPAIRLMFIDGSHEYEYVKKDILLWKDAVIDGGVIAFHDYAWAGVRRALDELVKDNPEFVIERTVGYTLFISKGHSRNGFLFKKMRIFDQAKSLILRRGAKEYGTRRVT